MVSSRDAIYKEFLFKDFNQVQYSSFFLSKLHNLPIFVLIVQAWGFMSRISLQAEKMVYT